MRFPAASVVAAFVSSNNHRHQHVGSSSTALNLMLPTPVDAVNTVPIQTAATQETNTFSSVSVSNELQENVMAWLQENLGVPPANAATGPPTKEEIAVLRQAFAAFYGASRDAVAAEPLLTQTLEAWQRQPPDERAGLYRVRGDCYMALLRAQDAIKDYSQAISLITGPGGDKADPAELPASYLGRARAIRSLHTTATKTEAQLAVQDYEAALKLSSREEWDTEQELLEDGARTNPYATWEYGMALRLVGKLDQAESIHTLASDYFDDIGDRARSVISAFDAGIDAAAANDVDKAKILIKTALKRIKTIEGRDVPLLQRVIAKEGEARLALASLYWTSGERPDAEKQLGLACERLDQLEADAIARQKANPVIVPDRLKFSIDDGAAALDITCSRLKNKEYLTDRLEWPDQLQQKANKLYTLSK